jgi:hypothetical protein
MTMRPRAEGLVHLKQTADAGGSENMMAGKKRKETHGEGRAKEAGECSKQRMRRRLERSKQEGREREKIAEYIIKLGSMEEEMFDMGKNHTAASHVSHWL